MNNTQAASRARRRSEYDRAAAVLYGLALVMILAVLASMVYILRTGHRIARFHTPRTDNVMCIQLRVSTAHLWLEEVLQGDPDGNLDRVREDLAKAHEAVRILLHGGPSDYGPVEPVADAELRSDVEQTRLLLDDFLQLSIERWRNRDTAGVGSRFDREYDALYTTIIDQTDGILARIEKDVGREIMRFRRTQVLLIGFSGLLILLVTLLFIHDRRRHVRDAILLAGLNDQLNAANQQLIAANQQLQAGEQQLHAANQQLQAGQQELAQANTMLHLVLDTIPVRVFWKDRDLKYLGCNRLFAEDAGLGNPDQIVGKDDRQLAWKEQAQQYRADDRAVIESGRPRIGYEEPQTAPDGRRIWLRTSKIPLTDPSGEIIGILGAYEDITQRRLDRKQRDQLMRTLQTRNKELQSIVYVTSHDLRSPLINIQGFTGELNRTCGQLLDMLDKEALSPDTRRFIDDFAREDIPEACSFIAAGAQKMDSLLSGLLTVSRIGTATIEPRRVDMDELLARIVESVQYQLQEKQVDLILEDLPPCLADPAQLSQVFSNLIDNALKYLDPTRPGSIRIFGQIEGDVSVYGVEDNGLGIPPEHQRKVFEIFHRLNPHAGVQGEGLGLTIVTRILDRLNGRIDLESQPDRGTTFYVHLPSA